MIIIDVTPDVADQYLVGHRYSVEHNLSMSGELIELSNVLCVKKTYDIRGLITIELQDNKEME